VQELLGERALGGGGLEVVFVLGEIFGHSDDFAADVVPCVEYDFGWAVGGLDWIVFIHGVLGMGWGHETGAQR
jgi:hypothetical protein